VHSDVMSCVLYFCVSPVWHGRKRFCHCHFPLWPNYDLDHWLQGWQILIFHIPIVWCLNFCSCGSMNVWLIHTFPNISKSESPMKLTNIGIKIFPKSEPIQDIHISNFHAQQFWNQMIFTQVIKHQIMSKFEPFHFSPNFNMFKCIFVVTGSLSY
jgi:hypothetical protein